MYNQIYSSPTLSNCTFENNSATEGGGIFNLPGSSPTSPALSNSILWNNAPDQIANPGVPDLLNPTISYSDVQGSGGSSSWDSSLGTDGGGNIDANPLFVDADTGDLRLQLASPAIDAGDNSAVPPGVTTDLVGQPRFVDVPSVTDTGNGDAPLIDMGAYEARYFALTVTAAGSGSGTISSDPPGINCGSDCSEELFQATIITLTASTDISSTFRGWSGACSGSSECMVAMNSDQVVTGSFAREDAGYVYLPLTVRESPQ
jgi:hypothetical protein